MNLRYTIKLKPLSLLYARHLVNGSFDLVIGLKFLIITKPVN